MKNTSEKSFNTRESSRLPREQIKDVRNALLSARKKIGVFRDIQELLGTIP